MPVGAVQMHIKQVPSDRHIDRIGRVAGSGRDSIGIEGLQVTVPGKAEAGPAPLLTPNPNAAAATLMARDWLTQLLCRCLLYRVRQEFQHRNRFIDIFRQSQK